MTLYTGKPKGSKRRKERPPVSTLPVDGFTKVPNRIFLDTNLKANERLVWIAIKARAFGDKVTSRQSLACIAEESGLTRRTVQRVISKLRSKGYLTVTARNQKTSLYTLLLPDPETKGSQNSWGVEMACSPESGAMLPVLGVKLVVKEWHHDGVTLAKDRFSEDQCVRLAMGDAFLLDGKYEAKLVSLDGARPRFAIDDRKIPSDEHEGLFMFEIDFDFASGHPGPDDYIPGDQGVSG